MVLTVKLLLKVVISQGQIVYFT